MTAWEASCDASRHSTLRSSRSSQVYSPGDEPFAPASRPNRNRAGTDLAQNTEGLASGGPVLGGKLSRRGRKNRDSPPVEHTDDAVLFPGWAAARQGREAPGALGFITR